MNLKILRNNPRNFPKKNFKKIFKNFVNISRNFQKYFWKFSEIFQNNFRDFLKFSKWSKIFFDNFQNISGNYFPKFSEIILEIFWYFSRKLYEIYFENFLKNFKKIHFWIFTHTHFKMKLKNLRMTILYKCKRSNTENLECRPVMSLLSCPLRTNEPDLSFNQLEWRTPHLHRAIPVSLILCTAQPLPHHPVWLPSTSIAFFVTLWFFDLVPYVPILKTIHVKKKLNFVHNFQEFFYSLTS